MRACGRKPLAARVSAKVIADESSEPGRVGTWILALLLVALAVLPLTCFWYYLERKDRNKERTLLTWMDKPILSRNSSGAHGSARVSQNKGPCRVLLFPQRYILSCVAETRLLSVVAGVMGTGG